MRLAVVAIMLAAAALLGACADEGGTEAADGTMRFASRKRDFGQINQAEFIDARRTMNDARLNLTRVRAEFLARIAELEFAVGDRRAALEDTR
jgi:outer membrane protein TolC